MATSCNCERGPLGTIAQLCGDHSHYEQKRCHGLIQRTERLQSAALLAIKLIDANLYHQREKVEDASAVLRQALDDN
jgi:hypothetical protein